MLSQLTGFSKTDGGVELAHGPQFARTCAGGSRTVVSNAQQVTICSIQMQIELKIQCLCSTRYIPNAQEPHVSSGYHTRQYRIFPPKRKILLDSSCLDKMRMRDFPSGQGYLIRARQQSRPLLTALYHLCWKTW